MIFNSTQGRTVPNGPSAMALDRRRLVRIEELANEVLRTQEELVSLDRQKNGRREALGAFRRNEAPVRNSHWIATSGQFIRLPGKTARAWLSEQQEETDAQIAAARQKLKVQMQALLAEHPQVTDLQSGVCELLTEVKETSNQLKEEETGERKRNVLDYSRFDGIVASDSEED
ncbi:unnamed protein product [Durusdinium trenchii]|uniref:P53 and DNA damage-regulated protein 1 n=1 Tax=Durusdinium trenchii TaxID=1381693 RepID=A0ABP0SGD9_9DINO